MRFGVDSASPVTDTAALKAHGVSFSCRYLSPPGNAKNITKAEAIRIKDGGLDIVCVWEGMGTEPLAGKNQGTQDARLAKAEAAAAGAPAGSPIYFALDEDPNGFSEHQWAEIDAYFTAVNAELGHRAVGAYGGLAFIKHLFDKKLIHYGWQTYAWSNGHWDLRAHLRQYLNGQMLGGMQVDFDHALTADFGQWGGQEPVKTIDHWQVAYKDRRGRFQHRNTKHPRAWALAYKRPFHHGDVTFHRVFK